MISNDVPIPAGAWDSHVHVIDESRFPYHPNHPYRPKQATLKSLLEFEQTMGVENVCLAAVSVYKNDNSSIMAALAQLNGKGRAVVTIDPCSTSDQEIDEMHQAGVRGIRLNLKTWGEVCGKDKMTERLWTYANIIRGRGWLIQLYVCLDQIALIHDVVPQLRVPVVIDHMASPSPLGLAKHQVGYRELIDLLQRGYIWIKLSGTYRFSRLPGLDEYARTLIRTNSQRVIWASDWPHTGGTDNNPGGDRHRHQDFRVVDDAALVQRTLAWCDNDSELVSRIFVDNPRNLWTNSD